MTGASIYVVSISGEAGLRVAQDLAGTLREALASQDAVTIATEAITSADITTIQLLLAARKQALASGKTLTLQAPPTGAFRELLVATGCLTEDGLPLTPDGEFWTPEHSEGRAA